MAEGQNEIELRLGPDVPLPEGFDRNDSAPFSYQEEALQRLEAWFAGPDRTGVLVLPTGAGKTRVAAELVLRTVLRERGGVNCLWLAHRQELADQAVRTIASIAHRAGRTFRLGRYGAGPKIAKSVKVVVASIPALTHRLPEHDAMERLTALSKRQGGFQLVILDEAHHATARTWKRMIQHLKESSPAPHLLGLTATPTRSRDAERRPLLELLERIVVEVQPIELIQQSFLARPTIRLVDTHEVFDVSETEAAETEQFGEISPRIVKRIAADEARNLLAVQTYVDRAREWGRTLMFAASIEQSRFLAHRLEGHGVRAAAVDGSTPKAERAEVLDAFRKGELDVLCNVLVFTEGMDAPGTRTVFLVRPTRSPVLFQQMVGRAMRGPRVGGVENCNIVAFVDHLRGLAERQVAPGYCWEWEQWQRMGLAGHFVPEWLEAARDAARDAEKAAEEARRQAETEIEARKREEAEAAKVRAAAAIAASKSELRQTLRDRLIDEAFEVVGISSTLHGWWEMEDDRVAPSRLWVLPLFSADQGLRGWVDQLNRVAMGPRGIGRVPPTPHLLTVASETVRTFGAQALELGGHLARWVALGDATDVQVSRFAAAVQASRAKKREDAAKIAAAPPREVAVDGVAIAVPPPVASAGSPDAAQPKVNWFAELRAFAAAGYRFRGAPLSAGLRKRIDALIVKANRGDLTQAQAEEGFRAVFAEVGRRGAEKAIMRAVKELAFGDPRCPPSGWSIQPTSGVAKGWLVTTLGGARCQAEKDGRLVGPASYDRVCSEISDRVGSESYDRTDVQSYVHLGLGGPGSVFSASAAIVAGWKPPAG